MRILDTHIENVRRHKCIDIEYSKTITLIGGPNEVGKSSIVEAMHRCLFLKATSSGIYIEQLNSKIHPGPPLIEIRFEAQGLIWKLVKRFNKGNGIVRLTGSNLKTYSGEEADTKLAEILGVNEIVGARKAAKVLPKRWRHLWVRQGTNLDNILDDGADSYDLESLINQLEIKAEKSLLSNSDQKVIKIISDYIKENLTKRGAKTNSPLWTIQQDLKKSEENLSQIRQISNNLEDASIELDILERKLEQLKKLDITELDIKSKKLESSRSTHVKNKEKYEKLEAEIEPIKKKKNNLIEIYNKFTAFRKYIDINNLKLAEINETIHRQQEIINQSTEELKQKKIHLKELESKKNKIELKGMYLRTSSELTQLETRKKEYDKKMTLLNKNKTTIKSVQDKIKNIPDITIKEINKIKVINNRISENQIRLESISAKFTIDYSKEEVKLNNKSIQQGEDHMILEETIIEVGNISKFKIEPSRKNDINSIKNQLIKDNNDIERFLLLNKISSIGQLDDILTQKELLNSQLKVLVNEQDYLQNDCESYMHMNVELNSNHEQLIIQLKNLASEYESLYISKDTQELNITTIASSEINTQLDNSRIEYKNIATEAMSMQKYLEDKQKSLEQNHKILTDHLVNKKLISTEIKNKKEQMNDLITANGNIEKIEHDITILNNSHKQIFEGIRSLRQQDPLLNIKKIDAEIKIIGTRKLQIQNEIEEITLNIGKLSERCNSLTQKDISALLEDANEKYSNLKVLESSHSNLTKANQLLLKMFQEEQSNSSLRYTNTITQSVDDFLKPILDEKSDRCLLDYHPDTGINNLRLTQQGNSMQFNEFSGGLKEQISCALRLAIGNILKEKFDGSLPIIFDDSFTNTDPVRINKVKNMLIKATKNGLQIVILSCKPEDYLDIADKTILLP